MDLLTETRVSVAILRACVHACMRVCVRVCMRACLLVHADGLSLCFVASVFEGFLRDNWRVFKKGACGYLFVKAGMFWYAICPAGSYSLNLL